jgi:hypothetical protein
MPEFGRGEAPTPSGTAPPVLCFVPATTTVVPTSPAVPASGFMPAAVPAAETAAMPATATVPAAETAAMPATATVPAATPVPASPFMPRLDRTRDCHRQDGCRDDE